MKENYKLKTNIPLTVKFQFDHGRSKEFTNKETGKPFTSWSYGVEVDGKEGYLSLTDYQASILKEYEPLKDKGEIKLLMYEEKGKKLFTASTLSDVNLEKGVEMANEAKEEEMTGTMDELAHPKPKDQEPNANKELQEMIDGMNQIVEKITFPKDVEGFAAIICCTFNAFYNKRR